MFRNFVLIFSICVLIIHNVQHINAAVPKNSAVKSSVIKPVETSLVVDAKTGKVLHARNARIKVYPASLTKLMTLYMTFDAIKAGKLSMNKKLRTSANAEKMKPSKLGLKKGEYITVREAILALIVKSANDAAVVLGENIAGSEIKFASMMTNRAHKLGMHNTLFKNASGWHHPTQKTTASDMAKLAIAIKRDYPAFYHLFSQTNFTFKGKLIHSTNRVTANYLGAEGLKTGYTRHAGYNLVTTASRKHRSLVAVVTGSPSSTARDKKMTKLLDQHFNKL